ncbi:uncharacterized protein BJX67DRAFT_3544 [Aspergillus lucknowensis]|uniref:Uncharacterized protein n=1 Tax=Aspergillus lucknowensis TaxID=176173 RepID=A0ABR4M6V0_9EURO
MLPTCSLCWVYHDTHTAQPALMEARFLRRQFMPSKATLHIKLQAYRQRPPNFVPGTSCARSTSSASPPPSHNLTIALSQSLSESHYLATPRLALLSCCLLTKCQCRHPQRSTSCPLSISHKRDSNIMLLTSKVPPARCVQSLDSQERPDGSTLLEGAKSSLFEDCRDSQWLTSKSFHLHLPSHLPACEPPVSFCAIFPP